MNAYRLFSARARERKNVCDNFVRFHTSVYEMRTDHHSRYANLFEICAKRNWKLNNLNKAAVFAHSIGVHTKAYISVVYTVRLEKHYQLLFCIHLEEEAKNGEKCADRARSYLR